MRLTYGRPSTSSSTAASRHSGGRKSSGPRREELIQSARRRELDVLLVWRLDRWGRSLLDLIGSLQELNELGVGFVSLSEALDLTTASGRALAGMFAEFERDSLHDRVKAAIAQARRDGKPHDAPDRAGKAPIRFVRVERRRQSTRRA